ncbi:MAG: hypothetical protein KBT05_00210 [Bacteroidales bacterium]|nr:hypothetical protein [Candidatus Cryptobacteroides caccocaballi]
MNLADKLKFYKDFPKPGINFVDIIPLIQSRSTFRELMDKVNEEVTATTVANVEARGFFFGAPLLLDPTSKVSNVIPIRKKDKLPFASDDLQKVAIKKEYGEDLVTFRISDIAAGEPNGDMFEINILDDVLATGGTAAGIAEAMNKLKIVKDGKTYGVKVTKFVFVVEIDELAGKEKLESIAPVASIIHI